MEDRSGSRTVNKGGNAVIRPLHESAEGFSYMSKQGDSPDYEWRRQLWECRRHGAVGFRGRLICEIGWHHEKFRPGIVKTMSVIF